MTIEKDLRVELAERAETFTVPGYDVASFRVGASRRRTRRRVRFGLAVAASLAVVSGVWLSMPIAEEDHTADNAGEDVKDPTSCLRTGEVPAVPSSSWTGAGYVADESWARQASHGRACAVVHLWYHRSGLGAGRSGELWVYSDGTLIVDTQDDGFVQYERRLTARGVERVRALVVSELGDPDEGPVDGGETDVWYRGRQYTPDDHELVSRLEDLSWLSAADWQQREPTVYRPDWYLLCHAQPATGDAGSAVRSLPRAARSLLESNQWSVVPGGFATDMSSSVCTILGPEVAGPLAQRLGGDIQDGRAIVEIQWSPRWSLTGLMPDGEPGASGD